MEIVFVQGGTFQMGSINGVTDEELIHSVSLSDFFIAKYEVTQGLWKSVMGNNPSYFTGDEDLPVEQVSWYDAVEFCNKLSEKEGLQKVYTIDYSKKDECNKAWFDTRKWLVICDFTANGYRLPTEAEWEYAARGGSQSKGYTYSGSNKADEVAWYEKNSEDKTHPVGRKQPNELGIYDMSGNVWEWCWDWYNGYSSASQTNPTGSSSGDGRVFRGGSLGCENNGYELRFACRSNDSPYVRNYLQGFRIVRSK